MENLDLIEELENKNPNLEKVSELYEQLEKALVSDPNDGKKWTELGHCSFILGNDKRAHESYQNALIFNCVDTPDLWYGIGLLYYKNSNFKYAEPSFLKVVVLDPNFPKSNSIYFKLGLIFKRFGFYDDAINYFNKCTQGGDASAALCQLGYCYSRQGKAIEASNYYASAYEANKNPHTALCLGWDMHEKDPSSAIMIFNEGLTLCRKDTIEELDLLYALARVLYNRKSYQEASNLYYKLLNKNSGDINFWNSFGIMCAEIGQSAQAFRCFIKASEISQNSAEVWNNIGALYWKSGQANESKLAYEKANRISIDPSIVKERTKEYSYCEWNISELPYITRSAITKMKLDFHENQQINPKSMPNPDLMSQNIMNNYAAMVGYINYARQYNALRLIREQNTTGNEEDKQAAEILTDLSQILPNKRSRDA